MKTVLVPIDFSPISARVIAAAAALVTDETTRLVLLNVVPLEPVLSGAFADTDAGREVVRDSEAHAVAGLNAARRTLQARGIAAHALHRVGPIVDAILEEAARLEADYIVMGSHGHGAFYDLLVGSTTHGLLLRAPCPVLIVPADSVRAVTAPAAPEPLAAS